MSRAAENHESFMARLRPFLSPVEVLDSELAYILAKDAHRPQTRKEIGPDGQPLRYFEHPRRVALILIDEVGTLDPVIHRAGLLHDSIEDTRYLSRAMIEHLFGAEVAAIVQVVSKVPKEGYLERLVAFGDWRAWLVKAADRLDNLRSLRVGEVSQAFRVRQLRETREHYLEHFEALRATVPASIAPGVSRLVDEIVARANEAI